MSFEERVINKTNLLINKYNGNPTKFQNHTLYGEWLSEGKITNNLLVKLVGETYESRFLIRNTKTALNKRNRLEIRRLNKFLNEKKHFNISIDKLSNFIGFLVSKGSVKDANYTIPTENKDNSKNKVNTKINSKQNHIPQINTEINKQATFFNNDNEIEDWEDWDITD